MKISTNAAETKQSVQQLVLPEADVSVGSAMPVHGVCPLAHVLFQFLSANCKNDFVGD